MNKLLLASLFLLLPAWSLHAQTEPERTSRLDRGKWETLTERLDYPLPQGPAEQEVPNQASPSRGWVTFFKILAVVAAIGIIAFIIAQLQTGESLFGAKNRKIERGIQIGLENIETHLPDADIPDFIRNALISGDFKTAVRLHYLGAIQMLAKRGWIKWERDKTNGDYLGEMGSKPVFEGFREATSVFERVWYGNRNLEEGAYRQIASQFADLEREIQKN